jgi:hypothetical protein
MHPEVGMGVVFIQKTAEQRKEVEGFIQALMDSKGIEPELVVEPDGLEPFVSQRGIPSQQKHSSEDPLIDLFENGTLLSTEEFLEELRKQRNSASPEQALSENF